LLSCPCLAKESQNLSECSLTRERANYFEPAYHHTLRSFGNGADLSNSRTLSVLAGVVRHFVFLVTKNGKNFLTSMLQCSPLHTYMTASDLAFAILVLEHHVMNWRLAFQSKLEDGLEAEGLCCNETTGIVYEGGIAGRQAKEGFDALQLYAFENFYSKAYPECAIRMNSIQALLDRTAQEDPDAICEDVEKFEKHAQLNNNMTTIRDDVLHRVFYNMHV
jgi:hypothetical protein